jgi:hypothetical protein
MILKLEVVIQSRLSFDYTKSHKILTNFTLIFIFCSSLHRPKFYKELGHSMLPRCLEVEGPSHSWTSLFNYNHGVGPRPSRLRLPTCAMYPNSEMSPGQLGEDAKTNKDRYNYVHSTFLNFQRVFSNFLSQDNVIQGILDNYWERSE